MGCLCEYCRWREFANVCADSKTDGYERVDECARFIPKQQMIAYGSNCWKDYATCKACRRSWRCHTRWRQRLALRPCGTMVIACWRFKERKSNSSERGV